MTIYYLQRSQPGEKIQAYPNGLMMIGGNPYHRVFNASNIPDHAVSYTCLGSQLSTLYMGLPRQLTMLSQLVTMLSAPTFPSATVLEACAPLSPSLLAVSVSASCDVIGSLRMVRGWQESRKGRLVARSLPQ